MKNLDDLFVLFERNHEELVRKIKDIEQLSLHLSSRLDKLELSQKTLRENLLSIETGVEEMLHTLDAAEQTSNTIKQAFGIVCVEHSTDIKKSELN